MVTGKPVRFGISPAYERIWLSGRFEDSSEITIKLPAVGRAGQCAGHCRSRKVLGGRQDVRGVKFTAEDIELVIVCFVMTSFVGCVMTTANNRMCRFSPHHFQSVGMNNGRSDENKHQHNNSNIRYAHTKLTHGYRIALVSSHYFDLSQEINIHVGINTLFQRL